MFINTRELRGGEHVDLLSKNLCKKLENFYKVIGDSTRLNILYLLRQHALCVHEISDELGISHSLTSHQLKVLKVNRLVVSTKIGNKCRYSLADDHVHTIIDMAIEHVQEDK